MTSSAKAIARILRTFEILSLNLEVSSKSTLFHPIISKPCKASAIEHFLENRKTKKASMEAECVLLQKPDRFFRLNVSDFQNWRTALPVNTSGFI